MKRLITYFAAVILVLITSNVFSQVIVQRVHLLNNIDSYFQNTGIFNQNTESANSPGFMWPLGSGRYAIFTTGLCIGAGINGQYAQSMASYKGEFGPGYISGGAPVTNANFKLYKISRGDNAGNNPDYANWYLMIPYGAPWIDVNHNGQYDQGIDSIGIRNASQVVFLCMTDGFDSTHSAGEGFGGGIYSPKLFSQIAWTSWCYDRNDLKDMQFIKWSIINKGTQRWDSTFFSIVCDPDVGDGNDDYIGCDTSKNLGYCYNADNSDGTGTPPTYGAAPPAVGMILHKSPIGFTSYNYFTNTGSAPPPCEADPNGEPVPAYNMMQGMKKDRSDFMNPMKTPPKATKFVYTGDPETNSGWNENNGSVLNCGGNTGTILTVNPSGDRRFIMSSGALDYFVNPNDTVTIVASQLIKRGNSYLSSVTLLKNYADLAWSVYNSGFIVGIKNITTSIPTEYSLSQNYPNPFNPATKIKFAIISSSNVKITVYDVTGKEVQTLVNERLQAGTYETTFEGSALTSGVYFYRLQAGDFSETKRMMMIK